MGGTGRREGAEGSRGLQASRARAAQPGKRPPGVAEEAGQVPWAPRAAPSLPARAPAHPAERTGSPSAEGSSPWGTSQNPRASRAAVGLGDSPAPRRPATRPRTWTRRPPCSRRALSSPGTGSRRAPRAARGDAEAQSSNPGAGGTERPAVHFLFETRRREHGGDRAPAAPAARTQPRGDGGPGTREAAARRPVSPCPASPCRRPGPRRTGSPSVPDPRPAYRSQLHAVRLPRFASSRLLASPPPEEKEEEKKNRLGEGIKTRSGPSRGGEAGCVQNFKVESHIPAYLLQLSSQKRASGWETICLAPG